MKRILTLNLLTLSLLLLFAINGIAQAYLKEAKYGVDEEARQQCVVALSLYGENYKQRNYDKAKPDWLKVLNICPAASQNTYIHGARMMKKWIDEEVAPSRKEEMIDSLMMIYDMRIEHFNAKGKLLGQKGMDLMSIDPNRYEEAYGILKESVEISGEKSTGVTLYTFMAVTNTMYENGKLNGEDVINTYARLADYLDIKLAAKPDDSRLLQVKENIDAIFTNAGVADCESLQNIFEPRINEEASLGLAKMVSSLLAANSCQTSDFYKKTAEVLYKLEPTAARAYELARIYVNAKDYNKAEELYKDAVEHEEDLVTKSKFLVEYGNMVFNDKGNPQQGRLLALEALKINPNLGHAYILIGHIYAAEKSCFSDDFQKKTVYWAAVDQFAKAKRVDSSVADDCDRLINTYMQYFPAKNDIFFQDLHINDRYTVGGWINEVTTVRARPE